MAEQLDAQSWTGAWRPRRPLATDDLGAGCWRTSRDRALTRRYLEHSPPPLLSMLVVDVDHDDALLRAISRPLAHPEPSWVAEGTSGRGHVGWVLRTPVCRTDAARLAPMRLAAKVEAGLRTALDGDVGYAGLLTKNPLHPDWTPTWGRAQPYDLVELAAGLGDLMPRALPRRVAQSSGLGRNVTLFNTLRLWAYSARRRYDQRTEWEQVTHAYALHSINARFEVPLAAGEVEHTARSVARWVWRQNFDEAGFRAIQRARSAKGASKGGKADTAAQRQARDRTKLDYNVILEGLR